MTVSWNDLPACEHTLSIGSDIILGPLGAEVVLKIEEELQALLIGEAVKGSCKSIHTC